MLATDARRAKGCGKGHTARGGKAGTIAGKVIPENGGFVVYRVVITETEARHYFVAMFAREQDADWAAEKINRGEL